MAGSSNVRSHNAAALAMFVALACASPANADVRMSMRDGLVSIAAQGATIRQILTEWARIGGTRIVNLERIPGGPVTIQLENVSEAEALAVLLRTASGYIAAPRTAAAPNASRFDRIIVLPTSTAPPAAPRMNVSAPPAAQPMAELPPPLESVPSQQADAGGDNAIDEQPASIITVGGSPTPSVSLSHTSRQALEVVDPRKVQFQMPQAGAALNPQPGAALPGGGALRPGMTVHPTAPFGAAGQTATGRR